jgi:hypothetical protein
MLCQLLAVVGASMTRPAMLLQLLVSRTWREFHGVDLELFFGSRNTSLNLRIRRWKLHPGLAGTRNEELLGEGTDLPVRRNS